MKKIPEQLILKPISLLLVLSIALLFPTASYASGNNDHKVIVVFKDNANQKAIALSFIETRISNLYEYSTT